MSKTVSPPINRVFSGDYRLGLSEEYKISLGNYTTIYSHYYEPLSRYNYQQEFYDLLFNWKSETRHISSITESAMHPYYQRIIGMGEKVVPLLLLQLEKQPDQLFWALKAITGKDPVQPNQRGKMKEMAQAWLKWGKENEYEW